MTWRWPWVSRWRLDLAEQVADTARELEAEAQRRADGAAAGAERERERHGVDLAAERERYERLVRDTLAFKREGFDTQPAPLPMPKTPLTPIPVKVAEAIARVSEPDSRERRQIETRVRDLLDSGVDGLEVSSMVLAGEQVDA